MSRSWGLACAAMAAAAVVVWMGGPAWASWLDWQSEAAWGQPWRWWTAAWVHLSGPHLLANVAGCVALAYWARAANTPAAWLWAWMGAWPLTHLSLLGVPQLLHYGGLSGVLHAGVAVVTLQAVLQGQGRTRGVAAMVGLGLCGKVFWERPWVEPITQLAPWDFPVAVVAHATGAFWGVVCAWVTQATMRRCRL